ncbi:hypothetical protein HPB50_022236 [Hyalomma asiaticum]|uniref:Uncharacterized protein n=1 Tax=Hyalomma asiaticum TaxID=266040 RepID=A0ACB7SYZ2_HYAAI|nr:hypothetical protein HPB50_022236 [Hyalomma asiaticum]
MPYRLPCGCSRLSFAATGAVDRRYTHALSEFGCLAHTRSSSSLLSLRGSGPFVLRKSITVPSPWRFFCLLATAALWPAAREIEDYLDQQPMPPPSGRQSRLPSPRRFTSASAIFSRMVAQFPPEELTAVTFGGEAANDRCAEDLRVIQIRTDADPSSVATEQDDRLSFNMPVVVAVT